MIKAYLDNAATTPVDSEVFQVMKPYFIKEYGNASEFHLLGQNARFAIESSREKIAGFLGSSPEEIIFTGSATESINLSHKGLIEAIFKKGQESKLHIITSSIEHKAVLETCKHLERLGIVSATYLSVDQSGKVNIDDLKNAIKPETVLVSLMYVNNEVGTIQPIVEVGQLLQQINEQRITNNQSRIYFHTDATQGIQYLNCNVDFLGVDLLSFTGHKIYAPKGIGALYIRKGTPIVRQMDGGGQEFRFRSGTENVPFIVGLGKAVEKISRDKEKEITKIKKYRDLLIENILKIPGVELTSSQDGAPHIASFIVNGVEGEAIVLLLSAKKVIISTGSACNASDLQPSHVLTAMGYPPEKSHGSIRFSLGKDTSEEDIKYVSQILPGIVERLKKMAPKF